MTYPSPPPLLESSGADERPDKGEPAPPPPPVPLSGTRKAAILLTAVGVEAASQILKEMPERDVERVSLEIARLRNVTSERIEGVLLEYRDISMARSLVAEGGASFAQKALEAALGQARADDIMFRIQAATEVSAFHILQTVDTAQISGFLNAEHPQTVALILANINPRKAAEIAAELDDNLQREAFFRLATMGELAPQVIRDFEEVVREQLGPILGTELPLSGGVEKVAEILNSVSRSAEEAIMDGIAARDANLATAIKNLMFVFDDLIKVGDRDLQRLLVEVDQKDLVVSLKGASESLQQKLLANVSERASAVIREELELLGPVKVSDVEESQRNLLEKAQELETAGEISLSFATDELLV